MRAVVIHGYGDTDVLEPAEMPVPECASGEVLIKVHAAAVNPADGKWRSGKYQAFIPLTMPHILGYDIAGTVEAGEGFSKGTRVAAMLNPMTKGGYAQYASAVVSSVAEIPDGMSFETAAAVPCANLTGVQLIETALDLKAGQRVLITGALGNVGRAAMFAARGRGAHIIAAVRADRAVEAREAGAAEIAVIGEEWTGEAFDEVADTIGGPSVAPLMRHLKPGGRIATASDSPIPPDGLPVVPEFYGINPDGAQLTKILAAVAAGALPVMIDRVLPLDAAAEGQKAVDAGGLRGKIILKP
ncbi:NADP-dependent oxidoreductase [Sphingobium sp. HBC34]|uniref:NADP-dependent oxidoreductase n=1 Tax=Sphingobium cyanobacteriorum TaxID=3063954 RepID=A0ABT8ZQ70_9SPHN|nr:NADP-dependent oxidoreductase [Sphingobium sp. HBC34]MDO7836697.1 NADP-dependent oxidoreductase [Sphingobium sp. HBC34]